MLIGGLYALAPVIGIGALVTHRRATVVELAPFLTAIQFVLTATAMLVAGMLESMILKRRRGERVGRRSRVTTVGLQVSAVLLYWRVIPVSY